MIQTGHFYNHEDFIAKMWEVLILAIVSEASEEQNWEKEYQQTVYPMALHNRIWVVH